MIHVYTVRNLYPCRSVVNCSSAMVVSIRYSTILKKRSGPYWIFRNTNNFFYFNSSLSNLYNNVIIYKIKISRENNFVCERIYRIFLLYIDVSLYLTLTIQASSRLKRSANHLWNNSNVCRKKFGEWSLLVIIDQ